MNSQCSIIYIRIYTLLKANILMYLLDIYMIITKINQNPVFSLLGLSLTIQSNQKQEVKYISFLIY